MLKNNLTVLVISLLFIGMSADKGYSISAIPQKDTNVNISSDINNINAEEQNQF